MPSLPFETSFLTGWSEWNADLGTGISVYSNRTTPYSKFGINNGPCATCMDYAPQDLNGAEFRQCIVGTCNGPGSAGPGSGADFGLPVTSTRFQYSIVCNDLSILSADDAAYGLRVAYFYCYGNNIASDSSGLFAAYLHLRSNGAFRLILTGGGNPGASSVDPVPYPPVNPSIIQSVYVESAPGTIAFDGVNHAITVTFSFTTHSTVHYVMTMDGATIFDGNLAAGPFYCSSKWGQPTVGFYGAGGMGFSCPSQYVPQSGINNVLFQTHRRPVCGFAKLMTRIAHVSIVDTPSAYPVDATIPVLTVNGCAVNYTNLSVDANDRITINGFNFPPGMIFDLIGPAGITTYNVISQTATEIVVSNLNPPVIHGAKYCIKGPCI